MCEDDKNDWLKLAIVLFILGLALSVGAWEEDEPKHYSWKLGRNESIPETVVITDPYGTNCGCPE